MGEKIRVAQMVTCYYCKRKYFVPTKELDKYTAQLEADVEEARDIAIQATIDLYAAEAENERLRYHVRRLMDGYDAENLTMQSVYHEAKKALGGE